MSRSCADQLIQDAVMYRFLIFHDQNDMSWKDQIAFTESMGDGKAHMETKTINRKVWLKIELKLIEKDRSYKCSNVLGQTNKQTNGQRYE